MAGEPTQVSLSAAIIIGSIPAIIAAVGAIFAQKALINSNEKTNKTLSEERLKLFKLQQKERYREILLPEKLKLYGEILNAISKFQSQNLMLPSGDVLAFMNTTNSIITSNTLLMPSELRNEVYSKMAECAKFISSTDFKKIESVDLYRTVMIRYMQISELLHTDLGADELAKTPHSKPAPSSSGSDTGK